MRTVALGTSVEQERMCRGLHPKKTPLPSTPRTTQGKFFRAASKVLSVLVLAGGFWTAPVQQLGAKTPLEWALLGDRPGDRLLAEYFRLETKKIADACLADIATLDQWKARREEYHRQLREMLGLDPMPPRTELNPVITGRIEAEDFIVEKLHFQSLPGLYVTGNLYLPKEVSEPLPAVLYVCGHGGVKKNNISFGNKCGYQHYGVWFARHGYVCLTIDTVQLGEIEGIHHGTYRYGMWWWNSYGYTPAGVEAWNGVRALDYLQSRKEVDPKRLGVTGRSGGGAYSWWIAALDERIQAAVPVAGITDLENHVVDGCVEGHCDCMYIVNTYRWDYPLVAALVAPRALLIGNTDKDTIFPLDGVARLYEKARKIYRLHGAEENIGVVIFPGPHKDLPELQQATVRFFDKHLKKVDRDPGDVGVKPFQPEQLKVFSQLPDDQINTTIQERFVQLAPSAQPPDSKEAWDKQAAAWIKLLQEKTFRAWPESPPELLVQPLWQAEEAGVRAQAYEFSSQEAVRLPLFVFRREPKRSAGEGGGAAAASADSAGKAPAQEAVFLVLSDQAQWESFVRRVPESLSRRMIPPEPPKPEKKEEKKAPAGKPSDQAAPSEESLPPETWDAAYSALESGQTLVVFAPRGVGPTAFNPSERKQTQVRRRFMLLGQTLEGMQLWDVRRAIQAARGLAELQSVRWRWMGRKDGAGMLVYAVLWEPAPDQIVLYEPPAAHRDGLALLNVRRIWDMPEALAAAAVRVKVRLHTTKPEMAQFAQAVLNRLGMEADRLEVSR